MKTKKMSLANIRGKLSRAEMKKIVAGSGGDGCSITHGACLFDTGAWDYLHPVCFSECQNDVWLYCNQQWGSCS
jgi:hypothetical protein